MSGLRKRKRLLARFEQLGGIASEKSCVIKRAFGGIVYHIGMEHNLYIH
jgi:hypothetical protein